MQAFRMSTEATARSFFSSPYFAVVGASNNPAKFGHKSKSASSSVLITIWHGRKSSHASMNSVSVFVLNS